MSRTERAATILRRIVALATALAGALSRLAVVAAGAVGVACLAWIADAPPDSAAEWIGRVVVLATLLLPTAILLVFVAGLRQVLELPERVRSLPADVRASAIDVRDRSRRTSERRGPFGAAVALVRLGRLVFGSRELISPYAVVAAALRPAILVSAMLAAVAALIEIPASALALLILLST